MVASPTPAGARLTGRDEPASLIGLDWGSSSLRAWLIGAGGAVLARGESAAGVSTIADGRFLEAFEALCGEWLVREPTLPVIACGMVGSRDGWREAGRVRTPAGLDSLASAWRRSTTSPDGLSGSFRGSWRAARSTRPT